MNVLKRYFSGQIKLLATLLCVTAVPLAAFYLLSPFEVPHIQFFFFGILFVLRIIFFREDEYRKNLKILAREKLQKKLKRTPSSSEIVLFVEDRVKGRDMVFFLTVFILLVVTVVFTNI